MKTNPQHKGKKLLKNITKSVAVLAAASAIGVGSLAIVGVVQTSDYSSQSQIEEIASELGVDTSNMNVITYKDNIKRLKHNNGEPIYVGISDDFNENSKKNIQDSLDYVFGIVNPINNDYTYQIVDDISSSKYKNKSTISYNLEILTVDNHTVGSYATWTNDYNAFISSIATKPTAGNNFITAVSDNESYFTYVHELLHLFGLADVYTYDGTAVTFKNITQSTIMNSSREQSEVLTRYDYAKLMALYTKPFSSKEQKTETIQKYKDQLTIYQKYLDDENISGIREEFKNKKLVDRDSYSFYEVNISKPSVPSSELGYSLIQIDFEGDTYTISSYIDGKRLVESCSGKFEDFGDIKVLRDVNLLYGTSPTLADKQEYDKNPYNAIVSDVYITSAGILNYMIHTGMSQIDRCTHGVYAFERNALLEIESRREMSK